MADQYSADEARRIFARAARRQHVAPAEDGLTVAELEAIGREAGLDPALVAAEAAAERLGDPGPTTWHGVPIGHRRSRLLPKRLSDDKWERVVDLLRAEFEVSGVTEQIGRRREWTASSGAGSIGAPAIRVRVEERPQGDGVTLEVPDVNRLLGLILSGSFGGMGVLVPALIAALNPAKMAEVGVFAATMLLIGLLLYGAAFLSAKVTAVQAPGRLETLLDRIDLISRSDDARVHAPPAAVPALDLDGLGEAPAEAASPLRTRVR